VPGIKFGLAFCEASGKCLVRWSGTDPAMIELAKKNATAIGAGHTFIVFLGDGSGCQSRAFEGIGTPSRWPKFFNQQRMSKCIHLG
jgi:hypothetical protein